MSRTAYSIVTVGMRLSFADWGEQLWWQHLP